MSNDALGTKGFKVWEHKNSKQIHRTAYDSVSYSESDYVSAYEYDEIFINTLERDALFRIFSKDQEVLVSKMQWDEWSEGVKGAALLWLKLKKIFAPPKKDLGNTPWEHAWLKKAVKVWEDSAGTKLGRLARRCSCCFRPEACQTLICGLEDHT